MSLESQPRRGPIVRALSRACERSALLTRALRRARFRGRCRIVSAIRRVPIPPVQRAASGGIRFELDLRDDLQRSIWFDCYEDRDLALIRPFVPSGGTCLDVGANVGFYALHFARRVGSGGRVFAFEPDPRNVARLRRNVSLNGFERIVEVAEAAVSDLVGSALLHQSDDAHSGWGSLSPHPEATASLSVRTTTLDSFLEDRAIERVDVLKADVEGAEVELLRGAKRSLARAAIRRLFIEFNGVLLAARGLTFEDFLAPLESAGYRPAAAHREVVDRMKRGLVDPALIWLNLLYEPAGEAAAGTTAGAPRLQAALDSPARSA